VFIIVCKNIAIAKVVFDWLANDERPTGIPSSGMPEWRNRDGQLNTIRVDTRVVHETDSAESAADEMRWMRHTLDTIGKTDWTRDAQGRAIYPEGFEELAKKLQRPLHPPGRDVRCIVSVAMLTEGWDANTVTHIVGLRPFMSQLLCEQVVGRGLRRRRYDLGENDRFGEEVAQVLGVPFEVIPFKAPPGGTAPEPKPRYRIHAVPEKREYEITFPRVEGYTQRVSGRIHVDWDHVAPLELDPARIPAEVDMAIGLPNNTGRISVLDRARVKEATLGPYHAGRRFTTVETTSLTVIKRSGVGEPFSRSKVINGVRKACQGRPVTEDDLALLAQEVEETIRASGAAEIDAHEVGLAILSPLQKLDEVAYLRFASVYQAFESLEDFEAAIAILRHEAEAEVEAKAAKGTSSEKSPL
jgi:transcriptional regulator NrdR